MDYVGRLALLKLLITVFYPFHKKIFNGNINVLVIAVLNLKTISFKIINPPENCVNVSNSVKQKKDFHRGPSDNMKKLCSDTSFCVLHISVTHNSFVDKNNLT